MKRILGILLLLLAPIVDSFAAKFELALAAPLAQNHEALTVKGRNGILIKQKLSFGNYTTVKVKRGWIRKWEGDSGIPGFIWTTQMEGKQDIRFSLTNQQDTSDVLMVTNIARTDLKFGNNPEALPNKFFPILTIGNSELQRNNLSTAIYLNAHDTEPWELFLDNTQAQLRRRDYIGYVYKGENYYQIVPVWDIVYKGALRQIPFGIAGFEIQDRNGAALAAVSLMDDRGIVYMGNLQESEKFLMANICSAILLQGVID